ncbi:MAG: hypothetical protein ACM3PY_17215 [Omnitrophica WOR_2 bacterium]
MNPLEPLEQAILYTIGYGDIFQYPMTVNEIHRYLIGMKSTQEDVEEALHLPNRLGRWIAQSGPFYLLPGRDEFVNVRRQREQESARLWPKALAYGRMIARVPFVRMVAVTGSLAMNNVNPGGDLDYMIVTRQERLWLARSLVIVLVRLAARAGDRICPNYFLSEQTLALQDQNIFSAHELVQMAPLSGTRVYAAIRQANLWADEYLPNAGGAPDGKDKIAFEEKQPWIQSFGESLLQNRTAGLLERWEMQRKLHKFNTLAANHQEACFGPDWCKGHVDDHGSRIMDAYTNRLQTIHKEYA